MTFTAFSAHAKKFYEGKLYVILCLACVLLGNVTGADVLFAIPVILLTFCGCFFCRDLRFFLVPLCTFTCIIPLSHTPYVPTESDFYFSGAMPYLIGVAAFFLVGGLVYFMVRNRKSAARLSIKKPSLLWGFLAFSLALALNGAFFPANWLKNIGYGIGIAASFLAVYIFFAIFHPRTKENAEHFLFTMAALGICVFAELVILYLTKVEFAGFIPVKNTIMIGWGIWTHIGALLSVCLPCMLYFAHSKKRWLPSMLCAALLFIGIFMTASRGAWLYGGIMLLICLIYLCISGKNRKKNRILCIALVGVALLAGIFLFEKILNYVMAFMQVGFSDNGRFELWRTAWSAFLARPVFGVGFFNAGITLGGFPPIMPYLYHNTVLQMLGSCGAVGFLLYAFHRAQTVSLLIRKRRSPIALFLLFSVAALVLTSLTDEHLFHIYPAFWYAIALFFAEGEYGESL